MTTIDVPLAPAAPTRTGLLLRPAAHPPLPRLDAAGLVTLLERAGLTGRGGAGFPTARKVAAVLSGPRRPVVVVNAMEGEHLSHKDAVLLRDNPGLVLDGAEVLRRALRAERAVVATGPEVDSGRARALARDVEVVDLPGGFVAGQESALVSALDGGPGVPRDPATPVWRRGVDRRPTLVVNAETAAQLALLVRYGAPWFRSVGTTDDPGTSLVTVTGSTAEVLRAPGVVEVERGTPLLDVLLDAGLDLHRTRAVLVGGYHGTWVPTAALGVRFARETLSAVGASPGAGVVHALDLVQCPLAVTAAIVGHLADSSARQCGPCVNGLPALAASLRRLASPGLDPGAAAEADRLLQVVRGRGACAHPDGTARLVASTLEVFADHVEAHRRGVCPR